jgi:hypothetical protein
MYNAQLIKKKKMYNAQLTVSLLQDLQENDQSLMMLQLR